MNLTQLNQSTSDGTRSRSVSKNRIRRGRGPGSGKGKTAGKGHKGQKARAGYNMRLYFEGGQMPTVRRLPKRGFNNKRFRTEYAVLNVADLDAALEDGAKVGPEELLSMGLINRLMDGVKVLAKGEITKKIEISAHRFSDAAKQKIEAAGGKAIELKK